MTLKPHKKNIHTILKDSKMKTVKSATAIFFWGYTDWADSTDVHGFFGGKEKKKCKFI